MFSIHTTPEEFENATIPTGHLDLCLRQIRSRDYRDVIVFKKRRFRDGLVWTVGLTVEIKLPFRDRLVWTVGLTVEIKLRFRDD